MLDLSNSTLRRLSISWVGNKARYEGVAAPKQSLVAAHDVAEELLIASFLKPFEKSAEYFHFHHEEDVSNNLAYQACHSIFHDPETIHKQALQLAYLLYEYSESPRVRGGEFLVAYINDIILNGEPTDAIGIWKVQTKDPYLKIERAPESYALNALEGIQTGKLETAALIFNLDESEGYRLFAVDTVSKKDERSFFKDEFLRLRPIEDDYFNTRHYVALTAEFIHERLPHKFMIDRPDQLDALYRSGLYFKENDEFEIEDFANTLFPEKEQREAFRNFRDEYAKAYAVPLENKFDISPSAVKRESKALKSIIKLDKNFHIYVHGRRDLIECGFDDEKGKKYYKVYFDSEE